MKRLARQDRRRTGAAAGLALLAMLVGVLIPRGVMVARVADAPKVIICTGHGPAGHDAPCVFAGHGLTAAPPVLALLGGSTSTPLAPAAPVAADLVPGRGLAAPPPPALGPPQLS